MAGAMLSMSDSIHASIIIHHQLKQQQQRDAQRAGLPQGAEPDKLQPHLDQDQQDEQKERRVGLCTRLMLVSSLFGIEMCMSFQQMYEVPVLQFLGVPVALVSVNGAIAGFISM
ncbi:hypothetical protein EGW08_022333, partial [Elysia chlorotica]